jgi:hypothetical protein
MAEGAAVDFETMLTLQLPDEVFSQGGATVVEHCSSLGWDRADGRPACVAQNMDVPAFADGFQLILHVKQGDPKLEAFVLTQVGCIGLNGMNSRSIGVCCNALWQLNGSRDGLPVACVVRGVLGQRSEEDAVAFLHQVKHASGQNYLIGGPAHAYSFECSAGRVERFRPGGRDGVVWHTNHPLANDDTTAAYRESLARPNPSPPGSSVVRLKCLENRLGRGPRDTAAAQAALASHDSDEHPVCIAKGKNGAFTFASTVMVLSDPPEFHVAPGPPDVTRFETLRFAGTNRGK